MKTVIGIVILGNIFRVFSKYRWFTEYLMYRSVLFNNTRLKKIMHELLFDFP